jgi:uncharacterized protein with HEPN domain
MIRRLISPRLADMINAIENIRVVMRNVSLDQFETDWQKRWLVERGIQIVSEAIRHLPDDIRVRNANIPWRKVAGIGNVLRHDYERIAPDMLWKLVQDDLDELEAVCRAELLLANAEEQNEPFPGEPHHDPGKPSDA